MQARALVTDIYMGTSNANASFRNVIAGNGGTAATNGETYDFGQLDELITGLGSQLVCAFPLCCTDHTSAASQKQTFVLSGTQLHLKRLVYACILVLHAELLTL